MFANTKELESSISNFQKALEDKNAKLVRECFNKLRVLTANIDFNQVLILMDPPANKGEEKADLQHIVDRIPSHWGRYLGCGKGWFPLLIALDKILTRIDENYQVQQVKEKYGELRYYAELVSLYDQLAEKSGDPAPPYPEHKSSQEEYEKYKVEKEEWMARLKGVPSYTDEEAKWELKNKLFHVFIDLAETKSMETCEECGKPGKIRDTGWVQTLCDKHAK